MRRNYGCLFSLAAAVVAPSVAFADDVEPVSRMFRDSVAVMHRLLSNHGIDSEFCCPSFDVSRWASDDSNYYMEIPMAGADKSDVKISVEDDKIKIEAEIESKVAKKTEEKSSKRKYSIARILPADGQSDKVDAKLSNGLLLITIPKVEKAKPKTITVR